jgi:hypothetical protein
MAVAAAAGVVSVRPYRTILVYSACWTAGLPLGRADEQKSVQLNKGTQAVWSGLARISMVLIAAPATSKRSESCASAFLDTLASARVAITGFRS